MDIPRFVYAVETINRLMEEGYILSSSNRYIALYKEHEQNAAHTFDNVEDFIAYLENMEDEQ